jgi:hypothetical protein
MPGHTAALADAPPPTATPARLRRLAAGAGGGRRTAVPTVTRARRPFAAFAVAGILTLTGCATAEPEARPTPSQSAIIGSEQTPTPTPTAEETPEPSPEPTAAPLPETAPACDQLLTLDWLRENLDDEIDGPDVGSTVTPESLPGPVARETLKSANVIQTCAWGIPRSDGAFHVSVLSVAPEAQQKLIDAMAASSIYTRHDDRPYPIYSRTVDDPIGAGGYAQGFAGGYWIIVTGTMTGADTAAQLVGVALDAAVAED